MLKINYLKKTGHFKDYFISLKILKFYRIIVIYFQSIRLENLRRTITVLILNLINNLRNFYEKSEKN